MITTYIRSSSYGCHDMCALKFFYEYVLGHRGPSNKKADKGTIVHKVLEVMADAKLASQNGDKIINNDMVGELKTHYYDINEIIRKVYLHYSKAFSHHDWDDADYFQCKQWVWKALVHNDGMFDPRKMKIVQSEQHFDFTIQKEWAKYRFKDPHNEGSFLEGNLGIKGTIDLITDVGDDIYEIVDWKTGKRLNWATGEEKDHEKLRNDFQLRLYHYAVHKLYPKLNHIMVTIFYINDGGPFSIHFSNDDLSKTEDMLRSKFEEIKYTQIPNDISQDKKQGWKCNKFCHAGMSTWEDSHVKPLTEFRKGQRTKQGEVMTRCEQLKYEIRNKGLDKVTSEYINPEHHIDKYKEPGSDK